MMQATLTLAIFLLVTGVALAASPKSLGVFGRWSAWTYSQKGHDHCFIYSSPTAAEPSSLDHGQVTFFVRTTRRTEAPTESSFQTGYGFAPHADLKASVDGTAFPMFASGNSAWLSGGGGQERAFLRSLERGHEMTIEAMSSRGNQTHYRFSLDGVTKAMQSARAACP